MFNIRFTPRAVDDLGDIKEYVSEKLLNPKASEDLVNLIFEKIEALKSFPLTGAQLPAKDSILNGYRFLIVKNYLVLYRTEERIVSIIRVLYARRDYMALLIKDKGESEKNSN